MTIKIVTGDIFSYNADMIINPVNSNGIMGKGLALKFKNKFKENYNFYVKHCKSNIITAGDCFVYHDKQNNLSICNTVTKNNYWEHSNYAIIEKCIINICGYCNFLSPQTQIILIPALGCGCGGLNWNIVKYILINKIQLMNKNHNKKYILFTPK